MKKVYKAVVVVLLAIIWSYSLFLQIECNADIAGTYVRWYNLFELGVGQLNIKTILNPWGFSSLIAYILNWGNNGAEIAIVYLVAWFMVAFILTLLLASYHSENLWTVLLTAFILIPYAETNVYHMYVAVATLGFVLLMQNYFEKRRIVYAILALLLSIYMLLFTDDRVLYLLNIVGTAFVYLLINLIQKKKYSLLLMGAVAVAILMAIARIGNELSIIFLGRDLLGQWTGYGGSGYLTWSDVGNIWQKGIPSLLQTILIQWNVPMDGGMIQLSSFYWCIRIVLVIVSIYVLVINWKKIIKTGVQNMAFIDSFSTICITVVFMVNTMNGMLAYYDISAAPVNRYGSVCWFLLAVLLVRWIEEKISYMTFYQMNRDFVISILCIALMIGYFQPMRLQRDSSVKEGYQMEIDFLEKQDGKYRYGFADFWVSTPITAETNGKYYVVPGKVNDGSLDGEYFPEVWKDGGNQFNFIISDLSYPLQMDEETVNKLRGDYIGVYSNGDTIYTYDYDIRFEPELIMSVGNADEYMMADNLTYYIDMPVGTNRVEFTSSNRDNLTLLIEDNNEISNVTYGIKGEQIIYADVTCMQNTQIELIVSKKEDVETGISRIDKRRVYAAVEILTSQEGIYLNSGQYVITFEGENLKDMDVQWDSNSKPEQITAGNKKRKYLVEIEKPGEIKFAIQKGKAEISRIYYENRELFEADEKE